MDAHMRRDVISFDSRGTAGTPVAGEVQVVGRLATDVGFANMVLNIFVNAISIKKSEMLDVRKVLLEKRFFHHSQPIGM